MDPLFSYLNRLSERLDAKNGISALRSVDYASHKISLKAARISKETEYFHKVMQFLEQATPLAQKTFSPLMPINPHLVPPLVRLMQRDYFHIALELAELAKKYPDQSVSNKLIRDVESLSVHTKKEFQKIWQEIKKLISLGENSPYCFEWLHFILLKHWKDLKKISDSPLLPIILTFPPEKKLASCLLNCLEKNPRFLQVNLPHIHAIRPNRRELLDILKWAVESPITADRANLLLQIKCKQCFDELFKLLPLSKEIPAFNIILDLVKDDEQRLGVLIRFIKTKNAGFQELYDFYRYEKWAQPFFKIYPYSSQRLNLYIFPRDYPDLHSRFETWSKSIGSPLLYTQLFEKVINYLMENPSEAEDFFSFTKTAPQTIVRLMESNQKLSILKHSWQKELWKQVLLSEHQPFIWEATFNFISQESEENCRLFFSLKEKYPKLIAAAFNVAHDVEDLLTVVLNFIKKHPDFVRPLTQAMQVGQYDANRNILFVGPKFFERLANPSEAFLEMLSTFSEHPALLIAYHSNENSNRKVLINRLISSHKTLKQNKVPQSKFFLDQLAQLIHMRDEEEIIYVLHLLESKNYSLAKLYIYLLFSNDKELLDICRTFENNPTPYDLEIINAKESISLNVVKSKIALKKITHPISLRIQSESTLYQNHHLIAYILKATTQDMDRLELLLPQSSHNLEDAFYLQCVKTGMTHLLTRYPEISSEMLWLISSLSWETEQQKLLIEQTLDLIDLLNNNVSLKNRILKIYEQIKHLKDNTVQLAKLLLLLERNPLSLNKSEITSSSITHLFNREFSLAFIEWTHLFDGVISIQKDEFDNAATTLLGRLFANILLTKKGRFNRGLIPLLLDSDQSICPNWKSTAGYIKHIQPLLKRIEFDYEVEQAISTMEIVSMPTLMDNAVRKVIRKNHGTLHSEEIRVGILSALLYPIRQHKVGSCFATSAAISIQKEFPHQVLQDLSQLLSKDELKTQLDDDVKKIPAVYANAITEENSIAKVWEFTLANTMIRKNLLEKFFTKINHILLKPQLEKIVFDASEYIAIESVTDNIKKLILEQFAFNFDPSRKTDLAEDGQSNQGAWILYYQKQKIMSAKDLHQALHNILQEVLRKSSAEEAHLAGDLITYLNDLKMFRKLYEFLGQDYAVNRLEDFTEANAIPLDFWNNENGGYTSDVIEGYRKGLNFYVNHAFHYESSFEGVLRYILEEIEQRPTTIADHSFCLMGIGPHAVSLLSKHSSLKKEAIEAMKNEAKKWDNLPISQTPYPYKEQISYGGNYGLTIPTKFLILDKAEYDTYKGLCDKLDPKITVKDFFKALPSLVEMATGSSEKVNAVLTAFDQLTFKEGPKGRAFVHAMDTNWERSPIHNLIFTGTKGKANYHFAFGYSPVHGCISLYQTTDDEKSIHALDQREWLSGFLSYIKVIAS